MTLTRCRSHQDTDHFIDAVQDTDVETMVDESGKSEPVTPTRPQGTIHDIAVNRRDEPAVPMQSIQATRMSFIQDSKGSLHEDTFATPSSAQEKEWSRVPTKQEEIITGLKNKVDSLQGALRRSDAKNAEVQKERTALSQANKELQKNVTALTAQCASLSNELKLAQGTEFGDHQTA